MLACIAYVSDLECSVASDLLLDRNVPLPGVRDKPACVFESGGRYRRIGKRCGCIQRAVNGRANYKWRRVGKLFGNAYRFTRVKLTRACAQGSPAVAVDVPRNTNAGSDAVIVFLHQSVVWTRCAVRQPQVNAEGSEISILLGTRALPRYSQRAIAGVRRVGQRLPIVPGLRIEVRHW